MRHLAHHHDDDETELATLGHFSDDYGDEPIFKCQNCASKNPGYEEKEASLLTIIAAVLCLIIFRLYSFLILPLVVESTKTIIKKCVKCDHVLDKQELLSMPSLTDKILSFKCGSCAMVISRKYALVLIAILSVIWFLIPSSNTSVVNPGGLNLSHLKWEDFVEDCGRKVVLSNQVRAKRSFDNKYANNIIDWEGVVHTVYTKHDIQNNPFIGFIILIKMNPSDANEKFSDLQLVFSNNLAARYAEILKIVHAGDILEFKGILRTMGDEFRFHEIEVQSIHLTGNKMNIDDIPMISYTGSGNMRRTKPEEIDSSASDKSKTRHKAERVEPTTQTSSNQDNAGDNKSQDQSNQVKEDQTSQNNEPEKVTTNEPAQSTDQTPPTDDQVIQDTPVDDQNNQVIDEPVLADQIDDQAGDQAGDQAVDQVDDLAADQVGDQAADQVDDQSAPLDDGQANLLDDQGDQGVVVDNEPSQASEPVQEPTDQQADVIIDSGDA